MIQLGVVVPPEQPVEAGWQHASWERWGSRAGPHHWGAASREDATPLPPSGARTCPSQGLLSTSRDRLPGRAAGRGDHDQLSAAAETPSTPATVTSVTAPTRARRTTAGRHGELAEPAAERRNPDRETAAAISPQPNGDDMLPTRQTASRPPWRSWRPPPDSGARGGAAAAGVSGRASRPLSTTPGSRTDAAAVDNVRLSRHSQRPARGHQPQVSARSALTDRGRQRDDGEISSMAVAGGYRLSAGTSGPVRGPWICLLDSVTLSTRSARLPPAEETWWLSTTWSC